MKVIGFNFTKISSKRNAIVERPSINTNIEFVNIEKEKVEMLKDAEPIKVTFKCSWDYTPAGNKDSEKQGEIAFEGNIILATDKKKSKEIMKSWKKKKLSPNIQLPLFNIILRKCTPKAALLADEISLPSPIPLPKLQQKKE